MFDFSLFKFLGAFVDLFILSAPWLLLGFFIAGCIKAFLQNEGLIKHIGGKGFLPTLKAALIGAPLPLCSCGVVPVALGLRQAGASKNATISFLIATPETGVDSVLFTNALMGPVMAIVRPVAAVSSAILAGVLVGLEKENINEDGKVIANNDSCCSKADGLSEDSSEKIEQGTIAKLRNGLQFSFDKMLKDIVNWLMIGLLIAAAFQAFLPADFFENYGQGFVAMLVMALIGVPMYVCATASTPIAAGFLLSGLSPGAVLVFMLVGPASNIGTLAIIKKELGTRSIIAYLTGVVITAFIFGFFVDYLFMSFDFELISLAQISQHQHTSMLDILFAAVLALLCIKALVSNGIEYYQSAT